MNKRRLGSTGLSVSELCFGTWQIGGANFGAVPAGDASRLLRAAFDRGVNVFDMSNVYGNGRSEVLVGATFREHRDQVVYVTKVGYLTGIDGTQDFLTEFPRSFRRDSLLRSLEDSLRRLQTDTIDVVLLHDPPSEELGQEEVWDTLRELRQAGKVRHIGASVTARKAVKAISMGAEVLEIPFNILKSEAAAEAFPAAGEAGVGILARSPFAQGRLWEEAGLRGQLAPLAGASGIPAMALRYCRSFPQVSCVVTGMMNERELEENAAAFASDVAGPEEVARLSSIAVPA